jgi:hypothetical protein
MSDGVTDIGRGKNGLLRDPASHIQKSVRLRYLTCPSGLAPSQKKAKRFEQKLTKEAKI